MLEETMELEINTACGLEGQTVDDYVNAVRNYVNG